MTIRRAVDANLREWVWARPSLILALSDEFE
jgi:hypothetical protein